MYNISWTNLFGEIINVTVQKLNASLLLAAQGHHLHLFTAEFTWNTTKSNRARHHVNSTNIIR